MEGATRNIQSVDLLQDLGSGRGGAIEALVCFQPLVMLREGLRAVRQSVRKLLTALGLRLTTAPLLDIGPRVMILVGRKTIVTRSVVLTASCVS
jgi:hypothetical protein